MVELELTECIYSVNKMRQWHNHCETDRPKGRTIETEA